MTGPSRAWLGPDAPVRRRLRDGLRRVLPAELVWRRALPDEVAFWARYVETRGLEHPDEFRRRTDPQAPVEDVLLLRAIDAVAPTQPAGAPVRVVDVGAGPLSSVGARDPRAVARRIELTAVDPLADRYAEMLARAGVRAPVATRACRAEELVERFGAAAFDVAYARNSLDHAADAMAAIWNMVSIVRPGGRVVLVHGRREGEARGYEQLHQWNFDVEDGRLVLWSRRARFDVAERLIDLARVVHVQAFDVPGVGPFVSAELERVAT